MSTHVCTWSHTQSQGHHAGSQLSSLHTSLAFTVANYKHKPWRHLKGECFDANLEKKRNFETLFHALYGSKKENYSWFHSAIKLIQS